MYNSHTHTNNSHDGTAQIQDLCIEAISCGLSGFAVTDHCDVEYCDNPEVCERIEKSINDSLWAKEKYKNKIFVGTGIEIGESIFNIKFTNNLINLNCWDAILSSVHYVRNMPWEMPFSMIDFSDADKSLLHKFLSQYLIDMKDMMEITDFDILCHLTVPLRYIEKKYKRKIDIEKYYPAIIDILKEVIKRDLALEINTSGFITGENYFMPDEKILDFYKDLGGKRISLGSDSHTVSALTKGLYEGAQMLKSKGFNTITYYKERKPIEYDI